MDMSAVFKTLERKVVAEVRFGGFVLQISNSLLCVWIVMGLLIVLSLFAARKLTERPGRRQIVVETLVGFVRNMCRNTIGEHHYRRFVPYIGSLLLFIGLCNILGVFNFIPGLHLYPPTKDINVTAPLAILTLLWMLYATLRYRGPLGTLKELFRPIPIVFPFKLMEYVTKPLSLCLRLFGNIVAAFLIMELVFRFLPPAAAPFSAYFDLFDGVLQAYIFVFLTCVYIGESVEIEA
jgi:F-type H+-transporting ATPase subunit a